METCCGRGFADEAALVAHQATLHPHPYRIELAQSVAHFERDLAQVIDYARTFTAAQRKKAASSGSALPDGSFPIMNAGDLKNAIKLAGNASNPSAAKAHIKKRAKALNLASMIPADWATVQGTVQGVAGAPAPLLEDAPPNYPYHCPVCGRGFFDKVALELHEDLVKHNGDTTASRDEAAALESWNDIQDVVREALRDRYSDPMVNNGYCYCYVADISADWVVFELKDSYYKMGYSLDDTGKVTFDGNPVEVIRRTVYVPEPPDGDEGED